MEIHILRGGEQVGPLSEENARALLARHEAAPSDLAWHDGLADWRPLHELLAPLSAEQATEKNSPAPVAATPDPESATPKQKALLSFMNIPLPPDLSKDQAARLVNEVMEDAGRSTRLTQWNEERLRLHPEIFAAEIQARRAARAAHFCELCQTQGAEFFTGVSKAHCQVLVTFLDVKFPRWDAREADAADHYFFPAVAEKFPHLVNKSWRGRMHYADGSRAGSGSSRLSQGAGGRGGGGPSALVAIARGLVMGAVILAGLYFGQRTLQSSAPDSLFARFLAKLDPPTAETPQTAPTPAQPSPAPAAAAANSPAPASTPQIIPTLDPGAPLVLAEPPIPVPAASIPPAAVPTALPETPVVATTMPPADFAAAPMAAMPATEPPAALPPPSPILSAPLGNLPPEAAMIPGLANIVPPPATPAPTPATAAKTNLLLIKPVELQLAYGRMTLPPGTPVRLVSRNGTALKVAYQNNVLTVPAASTDLE